MLSVDDLEALELTLEVLSDEESIAAIRDGLAELDAAQPGVPLEEVRAELRRRHSAGD